MAKGKTWDQLKMSAEDWRILRADVETYFTPGKPIQEQDLIFGRREQIQRLVACVRSSGRHGVIYGERGVGKSSIGNTFHYFLGHERSRVQHVKVQATSDDSFSSLWHKAFKRISVVIDGRRARLSEQYQSDQIAPDDVLLELESFSAAHTPIIVIDELDRLKAPGAKELMSDAIKMLSDAGVTATVICIGVAESVGDLIEGHESITRALVQIEMPRMLGKEIRDIIQKNITKIGMLIAKTALERIVFIAKGLPYYAHLLGQHAAQAACDRCSTVIEIVDIETAMDRAFKDVTQSIRDSYESAVSSERNEKTLFADVLLACALAGRDASGRFTAKAVAIELRQLTGTLYDVPQFSYHLNEFCHSKRGTVLHKIGTTRKFKFRFVDALMEPYVIAQSIKSKAFSEDRLRKLIPQYVPDLFST
jgi:Cdc6-like AAA superfamily ATPase